MQNIGLFPLGIVLFPESALPLHIFEDRYKKLIRQCWKTDSTFGITLIDSSKIYGVGCSAKIIDLFKEYSNGEMDILVKGLTRFKINYFKETDEGYYIGDVDYFNDESETINDIILNDCMDKFNIIVDNLPNLKIEKLNKENVSAMAPSYYIATKSGLSVYQKQHILEMRSENRRLAYLQNHLAKILPLVKEAEHISKIIKNDGYFTPTIFK